MQRNEVIGMKEPKPKRTANPESMASPLFYDQQIYKNPMLRLKQYQEHGSSLSKTVVTKIFF